MTPRSPFDLDRLRALLGDRAERERAGAFFVEGARFVHAAVARGVPLLALVDSPRLLTEPGAHILARRLRQRGVPHLRLDADTFRSLSLLGEPQGIGAVVPLGWTSLDPHRKTGFWLGVDAVRSAGNLGTMLRTACAAGAAGLLVLGDADPFDPRCVRATMGALFSMQIVHASIDDVARWKRATGARVIGADGAGDVDYRRASYAGPTAILLGCERRGLTPRQRVLCDRTVSIPMRTGIDSLNVAAAAAVLLYEAHRQRAPVTIPAPAARAPRFGR